MPDGKPGFLPAGRLLLRFSWLLPCLVIAAAAVNAYPGRPAVYLAFSIVFNTLLYRGFSGGRIFFDTFLGLYLWLGFWLKFSLGIAFMGGQFGEPVGGFDWSAEAFDRALMLSSLAGAAFLSAQFLRQKIFRPGAGPSTGTYSPLEAFYLRHRLAILGVFLSLILVLSASNLLLGIYQRGLTPRTVLPFGLSGLYTLLLLFGAASVSAVILNAELRARPAPYLASFVCLAECFFSNVSMLSRGMILNGSALVIGGAERMRRIGSRPPLAFTLLLGAFFCAAFLISVLSVNYVRVFTFDTSARAESAAPPAQGTVAGATPLRSFINRWVGIEGVMAVSSHGGLGWALWREAWAERYSASGTSLYDRTIVAEGNSYLSGNMEGKHFITLPGIVAFLYYPGSPAFLFFMAVISYAVAAMLEFAVLKASGGNVVLCALIGQVVAGRFAHFGYVPRQGYLLLCGILLVATGICVANAVLGARAADARQGAGD